ncbi:hypothetical protein [Neobacillus muris]|uniref:hypothetical protein n=1 Tax=Neobacillus muris TaxID=2941334 RepID=UPI00203F636B|nr:hypothetical protein [Neobacillus muris]
MNEIYNIKELNQIDLFFGLFNSISDLVYLTKVEKGNELRYVLANKPARELWGAADEDLFGEPLKKIMAQEIYKTVEVNYFKAIKKKEPITYVEKVPVTEKLGDLNRKFAGYSFQWMEESSMF